MFVRFFLHKVLNTANTFITYDNY